MVDRLIAVDDIDFLLPRPVLDALKPTIFDGAAAYLATSQAVIDAAALGVGNAIANENLVRKTDFGLYQTLDDALLDSSVEPLLISITDGAGNRTWLEAGKATGGPSKFAESILRTLLGLFSNQSDPSTLFSVTDSNGYQTDLTVRASDGQVPDWVLQRQATRLTPLIKPSLQESGLGGKVNPSVGSTSALMPLLSSVSRGAGRHADNVPLPANPFNYTSPAGEPARLTFPTSRTDATPLPLVIAFEGMDGYDGLGYRGGYGSVTNPNWIWARSRFHMNSWGSQNAMDDALELYYKALEIAPISGVILWGNSMGGIAAHNALTRNVIPNVVGMYLTDATYDLRQRFDSTHKESITSAYGIATDGSDYATKTAGFDPALKAAELWKGVPIRVVASSGDTVVPLASHSTKLAEKLAKTNDVQLLNVGTSGHNLSDRFILSDLTSYVNKYAGNQVIH